MASRDFSPRSPLVIDAQWKERARSVIPGGIYGHQAVTPKRLPDSYPQFYARGKGTRLWDVDGNEYLDFMCAYGPMIVGYANGAVDATAAAQQALGDPLTGPTARMVELAEKLTGLVAHADWAMFAKNGTDATAMAVTVARAATGRKKLLKEQRAYHGAKAWFTPGLSGTTPEDRANIIEFAYNDVASLREAADSANGDVAAIIVPPFKHDSDLDLELVDPVFAAETRALADRLGAVLILDEVRSCFRIDMRGAWESLGIRPDLTAFSKSLANGYPLSAITGIDALTEAASSIYVTGSFWYSGVAMAASLTTIELLEQDDAISRMVTLGNRLRSGLAQQAEARGLVLHQSGPVQLPRIRFDNDPEMKLAYAFTSATIRRGLILHPWHNMFLSAAHTEEDIDLALEITDIAFDELVTEHFATPV